MNFELEKIEESIGYKANNPQWLKQAFCHKSFHKENPEWKHNELLEFLGDAVLDLVVSDLLMEQFQDDQEGSLSRKRASVVNEESLYRLATGASMQEYLLIGEREANNNLRENPRIVASVFEAVVGAIYKDSGYEAAFSWIKNQFQDLLLQAFDQHDFEKDYKTRFQEWVQEKHKKTPNYRVIGQSGPDHARVFVMEVFVGEESWGTAEGTSKKMAAQKAAKQALERIEK